MPTAASKDARPGFHEPAKPGGDVGRRPLLPTRQKSGKTKNAFAYDAPESAEIENFPVRVRPGKFGGKIA